MEKYSRFTDIGTGVNPFVPHWAQRKTSPLPVRALQWLLVLPVALVRMLLLAVALLWLSLASALCTLVLVGHIRHPLERLLRAIGCRVGLLALGVLSWERLADPRRLQIRPLKDKYQSPGADWGHGSLVLSNYQGMTDVLYFAAKFSPVFAFPAAKGGWVLKGVLGALLHTGVEPQGEPLPELLARAKSQRRGPVVAFAEGAPTNGLGIIAWPADLDGGLKARVSLAVLEYGTAGYSPHHTVGSLGMHIWLLCAQLRLHHLTAQWLPVEDVQTSLSAKGFQDPLERVEFLRTLASRMIKNGVALKTNVANHAEFLEYWNATRGGGKYVKKMK